MSAFHILSAITSGIKAFETTGNPYVALGAAAIGGFSNSAQTGSPGGAPGGTAGGDVIGSLLGNIGGSSTALKALADQKPLDFSGLLSGDDTKAAA